MLEAKYRSMVIALFKRLHPNAVVFRFEDRFRAGVPDTLIGWNKITSWWEFKYGNPTVHWRGAQAAEMRRLWSNGCPAYYVVFHESREGERKTLIVPATIDYKELRTYDFSIDFNIRYVVNYIERVHQGER